MFIHIVKDAGFMGEESVSALLTEHTASSVVTPDREVVATLPVSEEDRHYLQGASQIESARALIQRLALMAWYHGRHYERAVRSHNHG